MRNLSRSVVVLVLFGLTGTANAFVINYVMDLRVAGQWTLWANTDAPGGIGSFVVNIGDGADAAATSTAPRAEFMGGVGQGFMFGNIFADKQAFAAQQTSHVASLRYGVGYQSIPDETFATEGFTMAPGTSAVLTSLAPDLNGEFVKLYTGTGNLTLSTAYSPQQPPAFGAVFSGVGSPTLIGPGPNLTATYTVIPVPEPAPVALAAFSIPAFGLLVRRCRNAKKSHGDRCV